MALFSPQLVSKILEIARWSIMLPPNNSSICVKVLKVQHHMHVVTSLDSQHRRCCVIWAQLELVFPSMPVLKVSRFSVGRFMLATRLVREHLDFCTSWGQITVILQILKAGLLPFLRCVGNWDISLHWFQMWTRHVFQVDRWKGDTNNSRL